MHTGSLRPAAKARKCERRSMQEGRVVDKVGVPRERIARSDESTTGVAVSGNQPGHVVPVHHRRRNTCIQARKSLETQKDDPRQVDGTQDEPSGGEAPLDLSEREGKRPRYVVTRRSKKQAAGGAGHWIQLDQGCGVEIDEGRV